MTDISKVDCAPLNPKVHPGQPEICGDKVDNNCASGVDEAGATGCKNYYVDVDKDGYGVGKAACLCAPTGLQTATKAGDCYDKNKAANPGATGWFTTDSGDGSFDYDCKSNITQQYGIGGKCSGSFWLCDAVKAFTSQVACGKQGDYVKGCEGFLCDKKTEKRTQGCR